MKKITELTKYYLFNKQFGIYYIYMLANYIMIIIIGMFAYYLTDRALPVVSCVFLPPIYLCVSLIFSNWRVNDYRILVDIAELNKKIKALQDKVNKL